MKQTIEDLVSSKDSSQLTDEDKNNIREIFLNALTDGTIDTYFYIISQYLHAKRQNEMTTADVAKLSQLPEMTIKRFENLQTIPKVITLLKILKAVGLTLTPQNLQ